ncbi:hypothetical protein BOX15_Mlig019191g2 [Macrostomum lignano]|uniref:Centrosomal protein POC5 n=1 Tax=Macrostomum lignano TaxID=282301 RepID=A0A267EBF9_9PLAT|nr:hypothetical protein BOX15_Mlig019191g2 [Macrostomum lignano]
MQQQQSADAPSAFTALTVQQPPPLEPHQRDALDSPGSSISSSLQREYDSLLSYAVPHFGIQLDQQQQQEQQQQEPPPIPPLPTQSQARAAMQQLRMNGTEAEQTVEQDDPAEETDDAEEDGSVTPSQRSAVVDEDEADGEGFDPTKTQLIDGLGNTGAPLMESLKAAGEHQALVDCGMDAPSSSQPQQQQQPPPPPPPLTQSQQIDQVFSRRPEFEQDLGSLLHASDADYRLSQTLGRWCEDLSRRMIEANHRVKLDLRDRAERLVREEKARLLVDMRHLRDENDRLRESVAAHRAALTTKEAELDGARQRLLGAHERIRAARSFADWRARLEAARRESAQERLAEQHYQRALARRALAAWKGRLETTWRQLVERGCQEKAMRVCEELGAECEDKLQRLQAELEAARSELRLERAERERAEASMREALMRGVSALNLEAMRVFGGTGVGPEDPAAAAVNGNHGNGSVADEEADDSKPMARSPRPSSRGRLPAQPPMQVATAPPGGTAARRQQQHQSPVRSQSGRIPQQQRQRAPLLVQSDLPGGGMSAAAQQSQRQATSVRVERHARPATSGGVAGASLPNFCSPSSASAAPIVGRQNSTQKQQQQPQNYRATTAPTAVGYGGRMPLTTVGVGGNGRFAATGDQQIRFID